MAPQGSELRTDWRILLGCTVAMMGNFSALYSYANGTILVALHEAFGWSRDSLAALSFATLLTVAVTAALVGWLVDRYGPIRVLAISFVLEAAAFALIGTMPLTFHLYIALSILLALCSAGTAPPGPTRIITATFSAQRGMALGIIVAGLGSLAVATPLLMSRSIAVYGWRAGFFVLAAWVVVAAIVALPLLLAGERDRLKRGASSVLSVEKASNDRPTSGPQSISIYTTPLFWLMLVACIMPALFSNGFLVLLTSILRDRGLTLEEAGGMQALIGVAMLSARLFTGWLMDHIPSPWVAAGTFALTGLGCVTLLSGDAALTPLAALLLGLTVGAEMDILAYIVARYFGVEAFGRVYGVFYGSLVIAGGGSALFLSKMADQLGGMDAAIGFVAGGMAASTLLILAVGRYGEKILARAAG